MTVAGDSTYSHTLLLHWWLSQYVLVFVQQTAFLHFSFLHGTVDASSTCTHVFVGLQLKESQNFSPAVGVEVEVEVVVDVDGGVVVAVVVAVFL